MLSQDRSHAEEREAKMKDDIKKGPYEDPKSRQVVSKRK